MANCEPVVGKRKEIKMKFRFLVTEWKNKCRGTTSKGWQINQDQVIRDHIEPYLGNQDVRSITRGHISEVLNQSRLKNHSANQQKKIYMVLSKIFADAVEFFEIIDKSPVAKKFHLPSVPKIEQPYLTMEQSIVLLEYVMDMEPWGPMIWTQLLSGIRFSELCALEFSDFRWSEGYISITKAYNRNTKELQRFTKNKEHYFPPIPPKLLNYLRTRLKKRGLAFQNSIGGMMSSKTYDENLKRIFTQLNLPITSSHGLRHSCATLYREMGASDQAIQRLLGHKTLVSTQNYLHGVDKRLLEIAKKIA
jgi:integrase